MGPNEQSLSLADHILSRYPNLTLDRIDLAYVIMDWAVMDEPETQDEQQG